MKPSQFILLAYKRKANQHKPKRIYYNRNAAVQMSYLTGGFRTGHTYHTIFKQPIPHIFQLVIWHDIFCYLVMAVQHFTPSEVSWDTWSNLLIPVPSNVLNVPDYLCTVKSRFFFLLIFSFGFPILNLYIIHFLCYLSLDFDILGANFIGIEVSQNNILFCLYSFSLFVYYISCSQLSVVDILHIVLLASLNVNQLSWEQTLNLYFVNKIIMLSVKKISISQSFLNLAEILDTTLLEGC